MAHRLVHTTEDYLPVTTQRRTMRIIDVKASVVLMDIENRMNRATHGKQEANLVQISTDEGITGTHLAWEWRKSGRAIVELMVDVIKPFLLGKDPLDRELIWQWLISNNRFGIPMIAAGAIDVCLWDIAGKAAGFPIYKLLGAYRDKVRAYASTTRLSQPDDYRDLARELKSQGYTAMKLHVKGEPRWDVEACQAAREGAPGFDLMLDSTGHYNRRDALWVGRELERLNFYWYEDPLPETDVDGLTELTRLLDISIAGAEFLYEATPSHFVPYLTGHISDIIRTDARRGITLAKKVADLAGAFNVNCELHSWGSIIGQAANLHVMGAVKNCDFFEQPVPAHLFETTGKDRFRIDQDGYVHLPTGPGLGVELDWDEVERRTVYRA
jgi:L-alanine-DL-glutamate epimerase-like enolase superfamily enzyme